MVRSLVMVFWRGLDGALRLAREEENQNSPSHHKMPSGRALAQYPTFPGPLQKLEFSQNQKS